MLIDDRPIIGICGRKQSGKDTIASMIVYILNVGTMNANYREWYIKYKDRKNEFIESRTIHFADYVKDVCSRMFAIPREYFDDIEYKENKWYLMDKQTFISKSKTIDNYIIANHSILVTTPLGALLKAYDDKIAITLRTMMQYVGTNVGREHLGELCWVRPTIADAINITNKYGYCIIPDVRFNNESEAIRKQAHSFVIGIKRDIKDKKNDEMLHVSESIERVDVNYWIDNNGGLMNLFYNVIQLVDNLNRMSNRLSHAPTGEQP